MHSCIWANSSLPPGAPCPGGFLCTAGSHNGREPHATSRGCDRAIPSSMMGCEDACRRGLDFLTTDPRPTTCKGTPFVEWWKCSTTILSMPRSPLYDPYYACQGPVGNYPAALSGAVVRLAGAGRQAD